MTESSALAGRASSALAGRAGLTARDVERFITDGFVRIDGAIPRVLTDDCRAILWTLSGCSPTDRATWTKPVVRIGHLDAPPFREAANGPVLHAAFDALVGVDRWAPLGSVGTFPIRFPSVEDAGDAGFHVDPSFGFEGEPDFLAWRVNIASRGRSLLMLMLLSDVGPDDAPTRILAGSHRDVARLLAPHGDTGMTLRALVDARFGGAEERRTAVSAIGPAGTVYLCHPFLVHAAQAHRGTSARFLAQPPLLPRDPVIGATGAVAEAIRRALDTPDT